MEFTYALRFRFDATNNEAEYEALISILRIAEQMGVKNLQENVDSLLVKALTNGFKAFSIRQIPRSENRKADALSKIASTSFAHLSKQVLVEELKQNLTPITSLWPFYKWGINIAGPFPEGPGKVKFLIVAMDYFTKWIEAKPVATITGNHDNPFKDYCEKLCIRKHFASVKHPQTNGLVERANRSLGEGIKARLDASKNWMEELSHVLWAHRTMIKSSNEDTPF
ncbi:reverse transcriptase domain-containing protein [Tanacetum coccineum]